MSACPTKQSPHTANLRPSNIYFPACGWLRGWAVLKLAVERYKEISGSLSCWVSGADTSKDECQGQQAQHSLLTLHMELWLTRSPGDAYKYWTSEPSCSSLWPISEIVMIWWYCVIALQHPVVQIHDFKSLKLKNYHLNVCLTRVTLQWNSFWFCVGVKRGDILCIPCATFKIYSGNDVWKSRGCSTFKD